MFVEAASQPPRVQPRVVGSLHRSGAHPRQPRSPRLLWRPYISIKPFRGACKSLYRYAYTPICVYIQVTSVCTHMYVHVYTYICVNTSLYRELSCIVYRS